MKLEDIEARYKAANLRELAPGFGKVFGGTDCLVVGYRDSMNGLPGRILCVVSDRDSMNKEDEAAADLIASLPDLLAIAQGQRAELGATKRALRIACEDLLVKSEWIKLFEGRITSLATLPEEEFDAACGPENGTQVQFGIRAGFAAGWKYSVQKLIGTKK